MQWPKQLCRHCLPIWIRSDEIINFLLKVIEKFYSDLIIASRKLNSIYSWSLLLWLFNVSSHTVSNTYFIITAFMDHDFEMLIQLCLAGWFLAYVTQLVVLHVACDFACTQVKFLNFVCLKKSLFQLIICSMMILMFFRE